MSWFRRRTKSTGVQSEALPVEPEMPIAVVVPLQAPPDADKYELPTCRHCARQATHKVVYRRDAVYGDIYRDHIWCQRCAEEQVGREVRILARRPEYEKQWAAREAWRKYNQ